MCFYDPVFNTELGEILHKDPGTTSGSWDWAERFTVSWAYAGTMMNRSSMMLHRKE
jgi:hypothetical protein